MVRARHLFSRPRHVFVAHSDGSEVARVKFAGWRRLSSKSCGLRCLVLAFCFLTALRLRASVRWRRLPRLRGHSRGGRRLGGFRLHPGGARCRGRTRLGARCRSSSRVGPGCRGRPMASLATGDRKRRRVGRDRHPAALGSAPPQVEAPPAEDLHLCASFPAPSSFV